MTSRRPVLLTYRTLGLGDFLTALPALRALRDAHPEHLHVHAAPEWLREVVAMVGAVDRHVAVDELHDVPLESVDVAVNLHGRGPRSHAVLARLEPRRLVAFSHPDFPDAVGTTWRADEHEVARWCRLVAAAGARPDPDRTDLDPPLERPGTRVAATLVHPGAASEARRWPAERFAAVAAHEHGRGREVWVSGSRSEVALARRVADLAGLGPDAVIAGRTGLAELVDTVAVAARVVCGDTGIGHLATALRTPSVLLFGPSSPDHWGPPADRRHLHRVLWAGRTGDPHATTVDPGLASIEVAQVLEALDTLPMRSSPAMAPSDVVG